MCELYSNFNSFFNAGAGLTAGIAGYDGLNSSRSGYSDLFSGLCAIFAPRT